MPDVGKLKSVTQAQINVVSVTQQPVMSVQSVLQGGGGSGTSNYNDLMNKPQIEGVTLSGNKTAADLGLAKSTDIPSASSATPQPLGTADAGSSVDYSRADHVHAKPSAADVGAAPSSTVIDAVSGSTPSITGVADHRYVCGEVATLDITLPASGCIDVTFVSGSTPTVLTVTPPTGVTVKWANGFDPTSLDANTVYEINILDGEYGVVGKWT